MSELRTTQMAMKGDWSARFQWSKVRLWALEPHDLALTKLERSIERDIRDVIFLARRGLIDRHTLVARFETELEPYITGRTLTWHRTTLKMWIDSCWPA
jgi:hypothetical protein